MHFYFGKVEINGLENIPKGHPIIFSSNHQNSFMDALLIGALSPVKISSLARGDVFGNHAGRWFMDALQMLPIFRMQDGINQLGKNTQTFETVYRRLSRGQAVQIFSEGSQSNEYYLRPLSKGSSRMALEAQEKMMDLDVYMVPVGINYFHHQRPAHKMIMNFGQPIRVKDYWATYSQHQAKGINHLKNDLSNAMRKCLLIPNHSEHYADQMKLINRRNEKTAFEDLKSNLEKREGLKMPLPYNKKLYGLAQVMGIMNIPPLWLTSFMLSKVKDIAFHGSFKWAAAMFLFPFWWILLFVIFGILFGWVVGGIILGAAIISLLSRQWLIKWSNQSH
jgi:1-acyl-sn-glycerol-3-phosphate acyltransferase/uncharacterized membrane protein